MKLAKFLYTIRGRMTLLYSLLFILAVVLISTTVSSMMSSVMLEERTSTQMQMVTDISQLVAADVDNRETDALYKTVKDQSDRINGRVLVLDANGIVLADSNSTLNGRALAYSEVSSIRTGATSATYGLHRVENVRGDSSQLFGNSREWVVYYTAAVAHKTRNVGIVLISMSIQDLADIISTALGTFSVISVLLLVALVTASFAVSRWVSRPITEMTNAISEMSRGQFDRRISIKGSSEIANMSRTFNMMSERLESQELMRSEFVANASHELKTPLSAMKILAESILYESNVPEATYKEFLSDINAQIDRLTTLLNDLLILTQIEKRDTRLNYTHVHLSNVVEEVMKNVGPIAQNKDVEIINASTSIMLEGDRVKLSTAISNLITNGIKYTQPGGQVRISTFDEGDNVRIVVSDSGMGIPKDDLAHIFERFYRVDKARSRETGGTGLGLSIVQQICRLHGGTISVDSEGEGKGSVFTMTLPKTRWDA